MIDRYARNGRLDEAFRLFRRMQDDDMMLNEFTVVALLIACAELGSLSVGCWVHEFAQKNGGLDKGVYVGTTLIDIYSKCGSLEDAVRVFDHMPVKSVATWNSMITSFSVHGWGKEAVALFMEMEKAKVLPDGITFVGVLSACVRECMVEEACRFFGSMVKRYGIGPCREHYDCLVELLNHADDSDEATKMVDNLLLKLDITARQMLKKLCQTNADTRLQKVVYPHRFENLQKP